MGSALPPARLRWQFGRQLTQGTAARLTVFGMALLQMQPEQVDWTGRGASAACGQMLGNKEERHGRRKNAAVSLFRALRRYPLTRALRCLSSLTPQDLGVSPEDAARARSRSGVAYQEIYAGADMTICIFLLRAGAQIPAHDHPGMHVFGRLLFGRMREWEGRTSPDEPTTMVRRSLDRHLLPTAWVQRRETSTRSRRWMTARSSTS